jgi:hypothetical protein
MSQEEPHSHTSHLATIHKSQEEPHSHPSHLATMSQEEPLAILASHLTKED